MVEHAFILSAGRSGSTLLSNLLNGHTQILSVPESVFLILIGIKFRHKSGFTEKDYKAIVANLWLRKSELKGAWNQNNEELLKVLSLRKPQSLAELFNCIYLSYNGVGSKPNPKVVVDKNPMYTKHLKVIERYYPNSKKIILVRDYRDRYVSIRNNQPYKYIPAGIIRGIVWSKRNKVLHTYYTKYSDSCMIVKYERLITDTDQVLSEVCSFLGLEFQPTMKDFRLHFKHDYSPSNISLIEQEFLQDMHHLSSQPITDERIGIWKNEEIETIEKLELYCAKTGMKFGYQPTLQISKYKKSVIRIKLLPNLVKGVVLSAIRKISFYLPFRLQKFLVNHFR